MKATRLLPFALTLLLAACGGDGPTPTPPIDPAPPTTPIDPAPPTDRAPVITSFVANPATITPGQSTTLTWSVNDAEIIRITPDPGQGDLSSEVSATVTPAVTTIYTMEAVSLAGLTDTASVTVTVSDSTEPPPSDTSFLGRWIVTFRDSSGVSFIHELNIDTPASGTGLEGGRGDQTLCLDDQDSTPCDDDNFASGTGFIGNLELDDGSSPLVLAIFSDLSGESELKLLTRGNAVLRTDDQGRQVLDALATWYLSSGSQSEGTISAVNVGAPRALDNVVLGADTEAKIEQAKTFSER